MRSIILITFLVSLLPLAQAQKTESYYGVVVDSTSHPIELVNVMAEELETQNVVSFGVTDSQGRFSLKLQQGEKYWLKASFVGYEKFSKQIVWKNTTHSPDTIRLFSSITELEAMEVVYEFPIVITGDTVTYKSEAFTTGQERKLGDVLEALPGFEVDKNGRVKVQGKEVEKILVDGKEFFEGDTKLATQNIPASAVDKVQLLRNFNDVSPLSGINEGDERLALNINLSEDVKNLVFGDAEAGAGLKSRYFAHNNLFFYNKKVTLNFIGDWNNIGEQAFTPRDYFRFSGGFSNLRGHTGSPIQSTDDDLGFAMLQNDNALAISSGLGAFNFNYVPNKRWNFSGFAILSSTETDISSINNRTYINTDNENDELLITDENRKSLAGLMKLKANYTPNEKLFVGYEGFVKSARLNKGSFLNTNNQGEQNFIDHGYSQEPFSLDQKVSAFYAPREKNVFSFEASYQYKWQNPEFRVLSSQLLFENQLSFEGMGRSDLLQTQKLGKHQQNAIGSWYHIFNKTNHFSLSMGNSLSQQNLFTNLSPFESNGQPFSTYKNDLSLFFSDVFIGADYTTKLGKFVIKPGVKFHQYDFESDQQLFSHEINEMAFLPSLSLTYNMLSSQSLRFGYHVENTFSDIQKLADDLVMLSYNNLYRGNRNLTFSQRDVFDLSYYHFSMFSNLNMYGGVSYQRKKRDFSDSQEYQGLERLTSVINTQQPNEMYSGYGGVTKTFQSFKLEGALTLSNSKTYNQINDLENLNERLNQDYNASFETTLFDVFTIQVAQKQAFNTYRSENLVSQFQVASTQVTVDWQITETLDFSADYEVNNYQNKSAGTKSRYDFLHAALFYQKEKSPWQWKIAVTNMLNTKYIRRDSFSESLISSYTYFVQPRYITATLKFDI